MRARARLVLPLLAVVAALTLAGCSTVVSGTGHLAGAAAPTAFPSAGSPTTGPSTSQPTTSGPTVARVAPAAASRVLRTPPKTRIGDPATADLCSAVGYDAFDDVAGAPEDASRQYLPGCEMLVDSDVGRLDVVAYVIDPHSLTAEGRTVRHAAGYRVYAYPYANDDYECPRYVLAGSFDVEVRVFPVENRRPGRTLACGVTDDMVRVMAAAVRSGTVPRLALPSPSITRFDACKVVRASRATTAVPSLAGAVLTSGLLGEQCVVSGPTFDIAVRTARDWSNGRPDGVSDASVGGHPIFVLSGAAAGGSCGYVSSQTDVGGKFEEVVVFAIAHDGAHVTSDECHDTEVLLSRYLDTAGLR